MGSMDELRSPSLPTRPAAPVIVFPSPSMLSVLQLLGTIRCPKKPRAAHENRLLANLIQMSSEAYGGCHLFNYRFWLDFVGNVYPYSSKKVVFREDRGAFTH